MAATPMTNTSFGFLKQWWTGGQIASLDDYDTPLLSSVVKRDASAEGSQWTQAIDIVAGQGSAAAYSTMYANSYAGVQKNFAGAYKPRFADVQIQDVTLMSARTGNGAAKKATLVALDGMKRDFNQKLNFAMYGQEGGVIGQLDTTVLTAGASTLTFTTATKAGALYIKPNMKVAWGTDSVGTNATGSMTVTARNIVGGTFGGVVVGNLSASAYIVDAGYTYPNAIAGLQSWCPLTDALAATTFKTVDRTLDLNGLGGIRVAGLGVDVEEGLIDAVAASRQLGSDPDICLIHPKKYAQLRKEMKGRIQYQEVKGRPMAGGKNSASLNGIVISGGGRPVVVVEDAHCPTTATWIIDSGKMQLLSLGVAPRNPNSDVLNLLPGTDTWQSQLFAYVEFVPTSPKAITVISHNAAI